MRRSSLIWYKICMIASNDFEDQDLMTNILHDMLLYDFLVTVKAAPHECVIRTGQP